MVKLPEKSETPDSVTLRASGSAREQIGELAFRWGVTMKDGLDFLISAAYESGLTPAEIAARLGVQARDG